MAVRRTVHYNAEDIWDTPEDGNRYEVIDGELFVTPPPLEPHQRGSGMLFGLLWEHIRARRLGRLYSAPFAVVLDEETAVQPDLVYVSQERGHLISPRGVEGPPDLVVEILSPSTRKRDLGIKMRRYAAAGIPHYWVLDPETRALEPYRLGEQGYESVGAHSPGDVFRPDLFPGLEIPIDALWD